VRAGSDLVVGFDLDMTLVDSRPGIRATYEALVAETGLRVDIDLVLSRLGPPLELELANWAPAARVAALAGRYRELYLVRGVAGIELLPGASAALQRVRDLGGRSVVVTAKSAGGAAAVLARLDLPVDALEADRWHTAKAAGLLAHGATVMVGDHVADMAGALAAGAVPVGVTTGPCDADSLVAAGAAVVLDSLEQLPDWLDDFVLDARERHLSDALRAAGSVLVAFSGGADSALVLAAAVRALGPERVAAATAISDSLPDSELAQARRFADSLGVRLLTPVTSELERAGYRANAGDRCWFCKAELLDVLTEVAAGEGLAVVATGTNADDVLAGFRPGIRAAAERGATTPLADAGLTKAQVRELSRRWGLTTWDKPAAACLSSRIAYGVQVTAHRLARVERAEEAAREVLHAHGLPVRDLRVRDLGERASVELDKTLVQRSIDLPELLQAVRGAGFAEAEVDPRGFRSGSMNERLQGPASERLQRPASEQLPQAAPSS
jgi:uncharacterized protein